MKIPNNQKLPQNAFTHSLHIDFKDFMNLYEECTAKPDPFLVIDTTLASDNPLCFRLQLIIRLEVKKYNMVLTEKQKKYRIVIRYN